MWILTLWLQRMQESSSSTFSLELLSHSLPISSLLSRNNSRADSAFTRSLGCSCPQFPSRSKVLPSSPEYESCVILSMVTSIETFLAIKDFRSSARCASLAPSTEQCLHLTLSARLKKITETLGQKQKERPAQCYPEITHPNYDFGNITMHKPDQSHRSITQIPNILSDQPVLSLKKDRKSMITDPSRQATCVGYLT